MTRRPPASFLLSWFSSSPSGCQPSSATASSSPASSPSLVQWLDTGNNYLFLAAALVAVVALIYVASAFVAAKLYEKREF